MGKIKSLGNKKLGKYQIENWNLGKKRSRLGDVRSVRLQNLMWSH